MTAQNGRSRDWNSHVEDVGFRLLQAKGDPVKRSNILGNAVDHIAGTYDKFVFVGQVVGEILHAFDVVVAANSSEKKVRDLVETRSAFAEIVEKYTTDDRG